VRANAKLALTLPNAANIYGVKFASVKPERRKRYQITRKFSYETLFESFSFKGMVNRLGFFTFSFINARSSTSRTSST